jgi:AmpD protein
VKPKYKEVSRQTPNFSRGKVIIPKAAVLHHTSGSYAGSVAWCLNPDSKVSYHCIVKRDGERTILASDNQRTWHAGKSFWRGRPDLNSWSLGVAFEGDTYKEPLSKEMIESAIEYLVPRMNRLSLTIKDVTDHRTVSPNRKNDLKPSEYDRFMQELKKHL